MRKRTSKRRLKARFLRGRPISLEDVFNYRLEHFLARIGFEFDYPSSYLKRLASDNIP